MLQVFIKTEEEDEKDDVAAQYTHLLTEVSCLISQTAMFLSSGS